MLVAVAGMSHRSAPVEVRERVAFPPCAGRGFLRRLKNEGVAAEAVLLSTCNRTDVYAVVEDEGARDLVLDLLAEDRSVERASLVRVRSLARSATRTGRRPRSIARARSSTVCSTLR